jgi:hypothetical protein
LRGGIHSGDSTGDVRFLDCSIGTGIRAVRPLFTNIIAIVLATPLKKPVIGIVIAA